LYLRIYELLLYAIVNKFRALISLLFILK